QSYAYDAIGNVLTKGTVRFEYCNHPLQPAPSQYCTSTIHPSAVIRTFNSATSAEKIYDYDDDGNTKHGAGRTFDWTADNRIDSISMGSSTVSMDYDFSGARIKKTSGSAVTLYPFTGYEISSDGMKIKFIKLGNELLVAKQSPVSDP